MNEELRKQAEKMLVGGGNSPEWAACQAVARAYLESLTPPAPAPAFDAEAAEKFARAFVEKCRMVYATTKTDPLLVYSDETLVAELRAALAPGAGDEGWRDIATAPKDGTTILAYWDVGAIPECSVHASKFHKGQWYEPNEDYPQSNPTHWMPLPEPPRD